MVCTKTNGLILGVVVCTECPHSTAQGTQLQREQNMMLGERLEIMNDVFPELKSLGISKILR